VEFFPSRVKAVVTVFDPVIVIVWLPTQLNVWGPAPAAGAIALLSPVSSQEKAVAEAGVTGPKLKSPKVRNPIVASSKVTWWRFKDPPGQTRDCVTI